MDRKKFLDFTKNYDDLSPELQAQILKEYTERINNNNALLELKADINTARQGAADLWKTGFQALDEKLDGGFLGEQLICLGAISSLGKTSFVLQMATQLAEQGKDVLIFSLEMSRNELNAKTISRYSYILRPEKKYSFGCLALTTRDVLSGRIGGVILGEELQATDAQGKVFVDAFNATKKISDHIHIFVGENDISVDDVRQIAFTHHKATGNRPFVILDYLQILQRSADAETTEKRLLTDYDVTRLKVLARDLHIPVLVISAFNRVSYLDPVSMGSFKESSGIEYSSDVLLAMQYEGMDYQMHEKDITYYDADKNKLSGKINTYENATEHNDRVRNLLRRMDENGAKGLPLPIELKILKNRNGTKGSIYFSFLPAYNYYEEDEVQIRTAPVNTRMQTSSKKTSSSVVSSNGVTISGKIK